MNSGYLMASFTKNNCLFAISDLIIFFIWHRNLLDESVVGDGISELFP